jgi:hypothetical protein
MVGGVGVVMSMVVVGCFEIGAVQMRFTWRSRSSEITGSLFVHKIESRFAVFIRFEGGGVALPRVSEIQEIVF